MQANDTAARDFGRLPRFLACLLAGLVITSCVRLDVPRNEAEKLYDPEKTALTAETPLRELTYLSNACPPPGTSKFLLPDNAKHRRRQRMPAMRYSPGDRLNLLILDQPEFSGDYAVNVDGTIALPFTGAIRAAGLTNRQLQSRIRHVLVNKGLFTPEASQISVHPVQYAPVNVTIAGAVFSPGRYTINIIKTKEKIEQRQAKSGDNPLDRFVPAAIRAAGGVRPDADLTNVRVYRDGKTFTLNWRGAIKGYPVDDMPLIEGDHVEVGEAGCFQSALVRPSQITPQGIKVFMSNLTIPALNNSASTLDTASGSGVPYGTRLLQGLVQANCVGGTYATNARRYGVLISRNPKTGKTEVVQRGIEDLVRSADRDKINPYLMPGDAIACYDSSVVEFRDVLSTLSTTLLTVSSF